MNFTHLVLGISWAIYIWESYLNFRQFRVYLKTNQVPPKLTKHIDNDTFTKAKAYSIDKAAFGFIAGFIGQLLSTVNLCFFIMPLLWNYSGQFMTQQLGFAKTASVEREIFQSLVFLFISSLVTTIIYLPLSIYGTFVVEERHGFNKQTARFYAWDKTKKFLVKYVISSPIMAAMIYIVRNGGPRFTLYLYLFCSIITGVLLFFHGEIMAIFDTFKPLKEGPLRVRIEEFAKSIKFPLRNIFVVENSKRSSHSNAYQSGIFNRKRIVIYDTLIENYYEETPDESKKSKGCNDDEIMAVLCHELGHWFHGHIYKQLLLAQIQLGLVFYVFDNIHQSRGVFRDFGFDEMPVMIGFQIAMMVLSPASEILGFYAITRSRKFEFQSDQYACEKGYGARLKSALIKLNVENKGFPVHDPIYSMFNHSHPTLMQRMDRIDELAKTK